MVLEEADMVPVVMDFMGVLIVMVPVSSLLVVKVVLLGNTVVIREVAHYSL